MAAGSKEGLRRRSPQPPPIYKEIQRQIPGRRPQRAATQAYSAQSVENRQWSVRLRCPASCCFSQTAHVDGEAAGKAHAKQRSSHPTAVRHVARLPRPAVACFACGGADIERHERTRLSPAQPYREKSARRRRPAATQRATAGREQKDTRGRHTTWRRQALRRGRRWRARQPAPVRCHAKRQTPCRCAVSARPRSPRACHPPPAP